LGNGNNFKAIAEIKIDFFICFVTVKLIMGEINKSIFMFMKVIKTRVMVHMGSVNEQLPLRHSHFHTKYYTEYEQSKNYSTI